MGARSPSTCANGYIWDGSTGKGKDVFQTISCDSVDGVTENGHYTAGNFENRKIVRDKICGGGENKCEYLKMAGGVSGCNNDFPKTRHERITKTCSTFSDRYIRSKRLQYIMLEGTAEHVVSASARRYFDYLQSSKANMKTARDLEYDKLSLMGTAIDNYRTAYLNYAEKLMQANNANQIYMEMVLEAEMVKLAYDQFQKTVQ